MTELEYQKQQIRWYKAMLRTCRERFSDPVFGCVWNDAANDISRTLVNFPDNPKKSIFKDLIL